MRQTFFSTILFTTMLFNSLFLVAQDTKDDGDQRQKRLDTIMYGLEDELIGLLTTLIQEENSEFSDEIYAEFQKTKSSGIRDKAISYFTQVKDARLTDYCLEALADITPIRRSTGLLILKYIEALKITAAIPPLIELIENENEDYLEASITTLGKIGSNEEALFLTSFFDRTLTVPVKQSLVRALGELQAVETWDKLSEIAQDENENSFMRAVAIEAIGNMKKQESITPLIALFEDTDPRIRVASLKGLSNFTQDESTKIIIAGFKDNHLSVRSEAASMALKLKLKSAVPSLLYRAKNDTDTNLRYKCYEALAAIGSKDGIDLLISVVENKRTNETNRAKAATFLLQYSFSSGIEAVKSAARESLENERLKNLRYALGKEFAKYENASLADICSEYLAHKDPLTVGTGLDMYAKNRFPSVRSAVETIADAEKTSGIKKKAQSILGKKTETNAE
ncbi:MAG: HEAT repeat domain-containing protein [Treponemataceae bacterium]